MVSASLRLIASGLEPGDFRLDELSGTSLLLEVLKEKRTRAEEQEQRRQRDSKAPPLPAVPNWVNGAGAGGEGGRRGLCLIGANLARFNLRKIGVSGRFQGRL